MSAVDEAREHYAWAQYFLIQWECRDPIWCAICRALALSADAASIALDLEVAKACREREDARLIAEVAY